MNVHMGRIYLRSLSGALGASMIRGRLPTDDIFLPFKNTPLTMAGRLSV